MLASLKFDITFHSSCLLCGFWVIILFFIYYATYYSHCAHPCFGRLSYIFHITYRTRVIYIFLLCVEYLHKPCFTCILCFGTVPSVTCIGPQCCKCACIKCTSVLLAVFNINCLASCLMCGFWEAYYYTT